MCSCLHQCSHDKEFSVNLFILVKDRSPRGKYNSTQESGVMEGIKSCFQKKSSNLLIIHGRTVFKDIQVKLGETGQASRGSM